jgi:uncharacterized membrane protein YcaP (DUF421 family)
MGKKQLGELQPSELVVTILLSNIATLPIEDVNIPVMIGLVPILTIVCLDVMMSYLSLASRKFRRIVCGSPKIIISDGKLDQKLLKKLRFTVDDLFEALRTQSVFDISQVQLAVVETTGQISVYVKPQDQPAQAKDLGLDLKSANPPMLIIDDGELLENSMKSVGVDREWIERTLKDENCPLGRVFIMTCDCERNYSLIRKEI